MNREDWTEVRRAGRGLNERSAERVRAALGVSLRSPRPARRSYARPVAATIVIVIGSWAVLRYAAEPPAGGPGAAVSRQGTGAVVEVAVVAVKEDGGVALHWKGEPNSTYEVRRCYIRPGLEACEEVVRTADTTFTDRNPGMPEALTIYRVSRLHGGARAEAGG